MVKKPILITGSHRSGSTWVGKMISSSPDVAYIHEPFNLECRPGFCGFRFHYWFTYAPGMDESAIYSALQDTLTFKYSLAHELSASRSVRDVMRMLRDFSQMTAYRFSSARPLIKDPIAIFSADWLSRKFDFDTVVLIRHPAAFVSSLKVKDWSFPFDHLLQQPMLMKDYLSPFDSEIRAFAHGNPDIVDQAILLWKIIHHVILIYQEIHPEWLFVRHEDISRDPVFEFQRIFEYLELDFSKSISQAIVDSTSASNQKETSANIHFVKRNSELNIWNWRSRLSAEEINRIRAGVGNISEAFYKASEWQPNDAELLVKESE